MTGQLPLSQATLPHLIAILQVSHTSETGCDTAGQTFMKRVREGFTT